MASSWRNGRQPEIVVSLRQAGHTVYDFRNPREGSVGFHWGEIDTDWQSWTPRQFRASLSHPISIRGFTSDMQALQGCDAVVLVLPCGRSAHLEAGWAAGAGKRVLILLDDESEPELMYRMVQVYVDLVEVIAALAGEDAA